VAVSRLPFLRGERESGGDESADTTGARQAQQAVSSVTGLASGNHTISIINRGPGTVAVDAIVVQL
jgi:hypothetical protein